MKILMVTPWKNTWIDYWTRYAQSRGHEVKWHINKYADPKEIKTGIEWCDVILCHWADRYAIMLTDPAINTKPLYLILRSYEIFSADGWSDLGLINWGNVKQLFMLNETHLHPFQCRIKNVEPIFFKNGVDVDEWQPQEDEKSLNKIAWICNINEKKGVELCVQAISELMKINPDISLEHIGQNQDLRRWYYLETIMPKLNTKWYNAGYKNSHDFVKDFLKDKGFIISSSIAEGNPMNIIEAMALGVIPLVHAWPGAEYQFPKELIWSNFDELKEIYKKCCADFSSYSQMSRDYVVEHYDYRKNFKPIIDVIENNVKD